MTLPLAATNTVRNLDLYWQAITVATARAERNMVELQPMPSAVLAAVITGQTRDRAVDDLDEYRRLAAEIHAKVRRLARIAQAWDYAAGGDFDPQPRETLEQWANRHAPAGCANCAEHGIYTVRASRLDKATGERTDDGTLCVDCRNFHRSTGHHRTRILIEAQARGELRQPIVDAELAKLRQAAAAARRRNGGTRRKRSQRDDVHEHATRAMVPSTSPQSAPEQVEHSG